MVSSRFARHPPEEILLITSGHVYFGDEGGKKCAAKGLKGEYKYLQKHCKPSTYKNPRLANNYNRLILMVPAEGIEPPTY